MALEGMLFEQSALIYKQRSADKCCEGMCLLRWTAVCLLSWAASINMTNAYIMHCV